MTTSELPLENKVALVTGASSGIGQAIAIAWAHGPALRVACAARSTGGLAETVAAIEAASGTGLAVRADVTRRTDVERMFEETASAFGGLDIVMINAGREPRTKSRRRGRPREGWLATIHLNLAGAYYTAREAIPHLKARGGGRILLMGSGMGHRAVPGASAYCVAKAGAWMLTRALAEELVEHGITVNEIIPGPVWTPATIRGARDERLGGGVDPE